MRLSLSQAATTSARCICLPVTVLHDYLSQLAPEGTPALKEATLPSTTASVRESERGRPQSHQNSLVGTDAINRNLHHSQSERASYALSKELAGPELEPRPSGGTGGISVLKKNKYTSKCIHLA